MSGDEKNPNTAGSDEQKGKVIGSIPVADVFKVENPKFMQKLRDAMAKISKIKLVRKKSNAEIGEVFATLENDGMSRKGMKAALAYLDLNPKDRAIFDLTVEIMRKAAGEPVQARLFTAAVEAELMQKGDKTGTNN